MTKNLSEEEFLQGKLALLAQEALLNYLEVIEESLEVDAIKRMSLGDFLEGTLTSLP